MSSRTLPRRIHAVETATAALSTTVVIVRLRILQNSVQSLDCGLRIMLAMAELFNHEAIMTQVAVIYCSIQSNYANKLWTISVFIEKCYLRTMW